MALVHREHVGGVVMLIRLIRALMGLILLDTVSRHTGGVDFQAPMKLPGLGRLLRGLLRGLPAGLLGRLPLVVHVEAVITLFEGVGPRPAAVTTVVRVGGGMGVGVRGSGRGGVLILVHFVERNEVFMLLVGILA